MIGHCDSCESEDVEVKHTAVSYGLRDYSEGDYCDVCLSISAVSAAAYGRPQSELLRALAFCTNTVLKAIATIKEEPRHAGQS